MSDPNSSSPELPEWLKQKATLPPQVAADELTLQRHFERFPFFQFSHSAFPVGLVGLVIAAGVVRQQYQHVAGLTFWFWKTALNEQARLRQGQRGSFF